SDQSPRRNEGECRAKSTRPVEANALGRKRCVWPRQEPLIGAPVDDSGWVLTVEDVILAGRVVEGHRASGGTRTPSRWGGGGGGGGGVRLGGGVGVAVLGGGGGLPSLSK